MSTQVIKAMKTLRKFGQPYHKIKVPSYVMVPTDNIINLSCYQLQRRTVIAAFVNNGCLFYKQHETQSLWLRCIFDIQASGT
jgi:hypothetical protein